MNSENTKNSPHATTIVEFLSNSEYSLERLTTVRWYLIGAACQASDEQEKSKLLSRVISLLDDIEEVTNVRHSR